MKGLNSIAEYQQAGGCCRFGYRPPSATSTRSLSSRLQPPGGAFIATKTQLATVHAHKRRHSPSLLLLLRLSQPLGEMLYRSSADTFHRLPLKSIFYFSRNLPRLSRTDWTLLVVKLSEWREWLTRGGGGRRLEGRKGNKGREGEGWGQRGTSLWVMEMRSNSRRAHGQPTLCLFVQLCHQAQSSPASGNTECTSP